MGASPTPPYKAEPKLASDPGRESDSPIVAEKRLITVERRGGTLVMFS
jgi:hypothetical protein